MKDQVKDMSTLSPEEYEAEKRRRQKKAHRKSVSRVVNRIFGFVLATVIMFGLAGLGVEYVLLKGPSKTLRNTFAITMFETRRFTWVPNIFLTEEEVAELKARIEALESR